MTLANDDSIIGGFFELHEVGAVGNGPSVMEHWTRGRRYSAFGNARSAFAALVTARPEATIWLPAFVCRDLVDASYARRIRFYPLLEGFEPALVVVEAASAGDIVLLTAPFGLPLGKATSDFVARRRDLTIVEDRAQALDAGQESAAHFCLYSPRKLFGVADGGILVANESDACLPEPAAPPPDSATLWTAPLLRYEDPEGVRNAIWYGANRAKESAMTVTTSAMTRLSASLLSRTPLAALSQPRLANWLALDERLSRWSALPPKPSAPPLGYVLRLVQKQRDVVLQALHADRIFAAVHWRKIAAPPGEFPREDQWTRELLTLPCDHRYGRRHMDRIASRVTELLR